MATDTVEAPPTDETVDAPQGGGKLKLIIIAAIAVVVIGQAAAIFMLMSNSGGDPAAEVEVDETETAQVEVEVDKFNCTNSVAIPGADVNITFQLVATVAEGQQVSFDEAANKLHKARVREAVLQVARSASLDELNDSNLSTIKRKIRESVNKVLRKSVVIDVVISEFRTLKQ